MPISATTGNRFLAACRGEPVDCTPVWFMRQAGRSLPEYHAVRGKKSLLDTLRHPELAAEITMQPVWRYGVDAAILYSDIMAPIEAIGFGVDIQPGVGPVVASPIRTESDLARLRPFQPSVDAPWVAKTVEIVASELDVPVIGFAGGPFTVASYLIEGGPSRDHSRVKSLMYTEPLIWRNLLDTVATVVVASLRDQIRAGASAVQLFDSWVGALSVDDYREYVFPVSTSESVQVSCSVSCRTLGQTS
jgi:uroporphyrinogen decarboxylase